MLYGIYICFAHFTGCSLTTHEVLLEVIPILVGPPLWGMMHNFPNPLWILYLNYSSLSKLQPILTTSDLLMLVNPFVEFFYFVLKKFIPTLFIQNHVVMLVLTPQCNIQSSKVACSFVIWTFASSHSPFNPTTSLLTSL